MIDELEVRREPTVVALDWGFAPQVRQLTQERIIPYEIFGYTEEVDDGFAYRLKSFLEPGTLFIFHWPNQTIFPRRLAFEQQAAARGYSIEQVGIISQRTGAPVFELLTVTPDPISH